MNRALLVLAIVLTIIGFWFLLQNSSIVAWIFFTAAFLSGLAAVSMMGRMAHGT